MAWFDAHLDLAYLALRGRDMHATAAAINAGAAPVGDHAPASITLPELAQGEVTHVLGTIFTEAVDAPAPLSQPQQYRAGDWPAARRAGLAQLAWYQTMPHHAKVRIDLLIECADVIDGPADVAFWRQAGVRAVGLTWVGMGRYAAGNAVADGRGVTPEGRAIIAALDEADIAHDVSHLADASFDDLASLTPRRLIASHSNCRTLLGETRIGHAQRHLRDEQIREIARRDGVIGLNLFSAFLHPSCKSAGRAEIEHALAHVEHICNLTGSTRHVGLGSDADGGFSAARLPRGIDRPADYPRLLDALSQRGWSDADLGGFASSNWRRALGVA
jgi:membrane dipeptidase